MFPEDGGSGQRVLIQRTSNYIFRLELRRNKGQAELRSFWMMERVSVPKSGLYGCFPSRCLHTCPLQVLHYQSTLSAMKPEVLGKFNIISVWVVTPCCPSLQPVCDTREYFKSHKIFAIKVNHHQHLQMMEFIVPDYLSNSQGRGGESCKIDVKDPSHQWFIAGKKFWPCSRVNYFHIWLCYSFQPNSITCENQSNMLSLEDR